ncbi:protein bfr2 [Phtheirospermum japonicum]|uniref:Protein bfr2 n=1 Tax=Phtheirospermum japonicum TaxID=374723 RepID=A0A830BNU6_9LAMI|nr:protein bfr2 [Phtheirospermum japonicum]
MGKKKSRKTVEGDDDFMDDRITHVENNYHNNSDSHDENLDDQSEDDYDDDDNIVIGKDKDALKGEEMEELEKEYRELRNEEQNILSNLKRHKDEDIQKGQAVKNQREPVRSLFCDTDSEVSEAYSDLIASSKKTLDSILELQQALVANNPSITKFEDGIMASFRNKSIDKWQRKTQVTTGAAAVKDKLHAFNQSISAQVADHMRDPSRMIKGMQQNRSAVAVFGNVPDLTEKIKQEETYANGDPELLDDSDFYQQLLKEFFETIDPSSSETAFYALKRLQTKKRKIVDRRASKSRKIRYNVHEKIVNFMAPRPVDIPPMAPKLFENLFGLKT